jgi:hypothetical protein
LYQTLKKHLKVAVLLANCQPTVEAKRVRGLGLAPSFQRRTFLLLRLTFWVLRPETQSTGYKKITVFALPDEIKYYDCLNTRQTMTEALFNITSLLC